MTTATRRCPASAGSSRSWACRSSSTSATRCDDGAARRGLRLVPLGRRDASAPTSRTARSGASTAASSRSRGRARRRARRPRALRGARVETDGYFDASRPAGSIRPGSSRAGRSTARRRSSSRAGAQELRRQRRRRHPPARAEPCRTRPGGSGSSTRSIRDQVAAVVEAHDLAVATSGAYTRGEHVLEPAHPAAADRRALRDDHRP